MSLKSDPWYTRLGLPWPSPRPQRKYVSRIKVGESIAGINIGAIKCTYHNIDAGSGRDKYMWRNTWTCIAAEDRRQTEEEHSFDKRIINYPHLIAFRLPTAYLDRNNDRHIADAKPVQEAPTTYNIQQLDDFPMRQQRLLNWQKETILSKEGVQSEIQRLVDEKGFSPQLKRASMDARAHTPAEFLAGQMNRYGMTVSPEAMKIMRKKE